MLSLISSLICFACSLERADSQPVFGGQCDYKEYKGYAKVTSIARAYGENIPNGTYEVRFLFYTDQEIKEQYAQVKNKEFLLEVNNFSYHNSRFLEDNEIKVGKILDCNLKVIVKGTCTPVIFEFPSIKIWMGI